MEPLRSGLKNLSDRSWNEFSEEELLRLLLAGLIGQPGRRDLACRLLKAAGSAAGLGSLSTHEYMRMGLDRSSAEALLAADRLFRKAARISLERGQAYGSSQDVYEFFRVRLSLLRKECFWVLLLDGKNRLLELHRVAEGSLTAALAHPREVFRPAVQAAAAGIICVHNHPSGDPEPSREDCELTRRLSESGRILGIRLLDHLVLSDRGYSSFADQGKL